MNNLKAIDISETTLYDFDHEVLETLLRDRTTGENIMWCTDNYTHLGEGYAEDDQITIEKIIGNRDLLIRPRALKSKAEQRYRTREKGEVFTPSWICNEQINVIDSAWFGREGVFNTQNNDHTWVTNLEPVTFPEGKTWKDYIRFGALEITCGEAPYLASRYDTTTGEFIPVADRIGLLDRRLRVVGENIDDHEEWFRWVEIAYQNIYGYEWQGDNLLLARESLLQTFFDYHEAKFGEEIAIPVEWVRNIAHIISWNLWQMDGLKCVIPKSCKKEIEKKTNLFGEVEIIEHPCPGCKKKNIFMHNGIYCDIMDWDEDKVIKFVSLIKENPGC